MKQDAETRAIAAEYMANLRARWKEVGYRSITSLVHEDDRAWVSADLDLIRFERMLRDIDAEDDDVIDLACTRNIPRLPMPDELEELKEWAESEGDRGREAKVALKALGTTMKLYKTQQALANADELNDIALAKTIVYGNMIDCYRRKAWGLLDSLLPAGITVEEARQ